MKPLFFIIAGIITVTIMIFLKKRRQPVQSNIPQVPLSTEAKYQATIAKGNKLGHWQLAEHLYSRAKNDQDPILAEAVKHYKAAVAAGFHEALLPLADIYNYCNLQAAGIPNKDLARSIYETIIRDSPSGQQKIQANIKLIELNKEKSRQALENRQVQHGIAAPRHEQPEEPRAVINAHGIRLPEQIRRIPQQPGRRNDSQNVHDSSVQKSLAASVEKLKKIKKYNERSINNKDTITQIRKYVTEESSAPAHRRNQALLALDIMEKDNVLLYNIAMNEMDVLALIWSRMESPENNNQRQNLRASLVDQLADCMLPGEHGNQAVCPTGRAGRVISSLELLDANPNLVAIKPKWALKEELNNLAAVTRRETLERATADERRAYEGTREDSDETRAMATKMTKKIRDEIWKRSRDAYINTNLMTEPEVEAELKPVLEAI